MYVHTYTWTAVPNYANKWLRFFCDVCLCQAGVCCSCRLKDVILSHYTRSCSNCMCKVKSYSFSKSRIFCTRNLRLSQTHELRQGRGETDPTALMHEPLPLTPLQVTERHPILLSMTYLYVTRNNVASCSLFALCFGKHSKLKFSRARPQAV